MTRDDERGSANEELASLLRSGLPNHLHELKRVGGSVVSVAVIHHYVDLLRLSRGLHHAGTPLFQLFRVVEVPKPVRDADASRLPGLHTAAMEPYHCELR